MKSLPIHNRAEKTRAGQLPNERCHQDLLFNADLPVLLLGHGRPCNLPSEELSVNASKDEFPTITIGWLAGNTQGEEHQKEIGY